MADTFVPVQNPAVTNTMLDASGPITTGAGSVVRERMVIADGVTAAGLAAVQNTPPVGTEYGLVVRDLGPNQEITALASAARTATLNSGDLANPGCSGGFVVLDVTAQAGGSITLTIQGKDPLSGQYFTLLAGVAVTTVSTVVYRVHDSLTAAANSVANDLIPKTFRILVTHNNASSITYSVGVLLVP